ncbi:hypothetical protein B0H13DRAFT_2366902 [Mycena leptocephala]|nr:hypothetical protein B0H13DRAFT_2366902 [Mycena leptocephala]
MPPKGREVVDPDAPPPIIDRATSTRAQTKNIAPVALSARASPAPSSSSKVETKRQASTSKTGPKRPLTSSRTSAPTASSSKLSTPTAASSARSIHAPSPTAIPFGTSAPRLPSHMKHQGTRAPQLIHSG